MKRLAALLALALNSCSYTGYWGANMKVMIDEPVLPGVPLARRVDWFHQVRYGKSEPTVHSGTLAFGDDRPIDRDRPPARDVVSGLRYLKINLEAASNAPEWNDEEGRRLIREAEAAAERAGTLQPPARENRKPERKWEGLGSAGEFGDLTGWALGSYVSRDAPEGSSLVVLMDSTNTGTDFGWTWQHRVTVFLRRGDREIVSSRATPWHIYTSPPSAPPADCVLAKDVLAGHKLPPEHYKHYDLGILLRSAATEIAHGQRLYDASVARLAAKQPPK